MIISTCLQSIAFAAFLVFPEGDKSLQGDVKAGYDAYKVGEYSKAIKLFMGQAAKGDKVAQFAMGKIYQEGTGLESSNLALAEEYYRKAAAQGHEAAKFNLAAILLNDPNRVLEGVKQLKDSAAAGSSRAQVTLGQLYASGQGVTQNLETAKEMFTKAAEKGEPDAYLLLAQMSELGQGATKDIKKAVEHYENAAKRDSMQAILKLANIYANGVEGIEKDTAKAKEWLEIGVEKEKEGASALLNLGLLNEAIEKKPEAAFGFYKKAAEKGDVMGMIKVANMLSDGVGVPAKEPKEAFTWYEKAAKAGSPAGMFALSVAYDKGTGVTANPKESRTNLLNAAIGGFPVAMRQLGENYRDGKGVFKDMLASITWLQKALQAGDGQSAMILSEMLEKGEDLPKNLKASNELLTQVAAAGSAEAQVRLADNHEKGLGTPQDLIRSYALLLAAGDYEPAKKKRDELSKKMSKEQLAEAEKEYDRMKAKPAPTAAADKPADK
jgi:uncharacterized protein